MLKNRQVPFIGREEELAQIKNFIEEQNTRHVLCILGPGGIGKTRLLSEIHNRYAGNEMNSLLVADIIDFDDRALHLSRNVERQIAHQLDQSAFEPYLRGMQDLLKMEAAGVSSQALQQQAERVRQTFVDNFNDVSSNQRLILLFDTVEKLENKEVWNDLSKSMFASKNALFVLAGRPDKEWWTSLQTLFGADTKLIQLKPLKEESSQQYLKQKQRLLHLNLEPQLESKLLFFAGGRPILLDLAIEWISRHLPLDWMTTHSLEELRSLSQEDTAKYKEQFETQLVSQIIQIRTPMDQLTLVMSRIYPLTPAMLVKLLRIPEDEAQQLFNEAQSYVFVKSLPDGQITLHDEMRRMVNEYVWPEVDPQGIRRRRDSRIAAELFALEDKRLKERLTERETGDLAGLFERAVLTRTRDIINQQWIEHALYSDAESGFVVWKRIVEERRTAKEYFFSKQLLEQARDYRNSFEADQQFEFDMLDAQLKSDTGEVSQAEKILNQLLAQNQGKEQREATIYNALGLVEEKIGKLTLACEHQLECLERVTKINKAFIPAVANRIGYAYRVLGEYEKAEKYYRLARKASTDIIKVEEKDLYIHASILNNLAYIYGLQKKEDKVKFYSDLAINTWKRIGAEKEIGRAESTRAIFLRDKGQYSKAIELFKRAINRCEEPDDNEQLCRTYFHLGWTQWYKAEIVNEGEKEIDLVFTKWDLELLRIARKSFEKSLKLCKRYGLGRLLPKILHQTASVYWCIGRTEDDLLLMQEARQLNAEAHQKSKENRDLRYVIDSLLGYAEWDYEINKYDQIKNGDYRRILDEYKDYKERYALYFGRMDRIEGDVHLKQGEFDFAFAKYASGLILIHRHGGFSRYTIEREKLRLRNKMDIYMSPEQIIKYLKYLYNEWSKVKEPDPDSLTSWCETQILGAKRSMQ